MRGLFTKIFLGFWIAQSVTFFISTMLIMRHRFVRPNEVMEVLSSTLPSAAAAAANAYETGGCSGLQQFAGSLHQTVYLTDSTSHFLCQRSGSVRGSRTAERQQTSSLASTRRRLAKTICGARQHNPPAANSIFFF